MIVASTSQFRTIVVAELMKSLPCREFDAVLTEDFETAVPDAAALITECTQVASKGATALSFDLECRTIREFQKASVA